MSDSASKRAAVCILAPVHAAFDVRVFHKEALSLVAAGYVVTLYAQHAADETRSGVRVKSVSYRGRLQRFLLQPALLWRVWRERAAVYHLHNPDTIFIGLFLKLLGKTVIYDTHEDFVARIPTKRWIPAPLRFFLAYAVDGLERLMAYFADSTLVTQAHQVEKFGGELIENYPRIDAAQIDDVRRRAAAIDKGGALRLIYVGEINALRGLFFLLDIVREINKRQPARLWITGTDHGEGWLEQLQAHLGWQYTDYLGYLDELNDVFAYISRADFGAALFEDVGDLARISSNKIYEYQTYGTPFLVTALPTRRAELEESGGVFVEFGEVALSALEIERIYADSAGYEDLAERGRRLVFERRNWGNEEKKLLTVYQKLVG